MDTISASILDKIYIYCMCLSGYHLTKKAMHVVGPMLISSALLSFSHFITTVLPRQNYHQLP